MTRFEKANIHPNYRALGLSAIAMLRQMIRDGHPMYRADARRCIKREQRNLLAQRRKLQAVQ